MASPTTLAPLRISSPSARSDRERLTGQRGLVEHGAPARERAVDGHDLAREHAQRVARCDLARRDVEKPAVPPTVGDRRCTSGERRDLAAGAPERALVEQLPTREHERDDETGLVLTERQRAGDREAVR